MRKAKVISLAFVVMLFFSLTAFAPASKPAKNVNNSSAQGPVTDPIICKHHYQVTSYGDWKLISSRAVMSSGGVCENTYERTVNEKCKFCGRTRTRTETKRTVSYLFGIYEYDVK